MEKNRFENLEIRTIRSEISSDEIVFGRDAMYTLMRIETKIDDEIFLSCLLIYREDWFEDLRGYVSNNDSHWRIVRVMSLWVKTKIGDEIFPRYFSFH